MPQSSYLDGLFLGLAVIGQGIALFRSRRAGLVFYLCVAPIGYFHIWWWATWDVARLCGGMVVGAGLARMGSAAATRGNGPTPLALLGAYGVLITIVMSHWWPTTAMSGASSAYGEWRWLVQVVNWLILVGVGCEIALCSREREFLESVRGPLLVVAALLSAYAIYQFAAYQLGLPMTGIRRPLGIEDEGTAAYSVAGLVVPRPGSLVGEPKGLGGACVFWLAVWLIPVREEIRRKVWDRVVVVMIVTALWLSASTSAWVGSVGSLVWAAIFRISPKRLLVPLALAAVLAVVGVATLRVTMPTLSQIVDVRLNERLKDPLGDLPEEMTLQFVRKRPEFLCFGTGLGGISLYLAQRSVQARYLILAPNNGLLSLVVSLGVAGLAFVLWILFAGVIKLWRSGSARRVEAFVGAVVLTQCFIFAQEWLLSVALGLLSGAVATGAAARSWSGYSTRRGSKSLGQRAGLDDHRRARSLQRVPRSIVRPVR